MVITVKSVGGLVGELVGELVGGVVGGVVGGSVDGSVQRLEFKESTTTGQLVPTCS